MIVGTCTSCGGTLNVVDERAVLKKIKYCPFCGKKFEVPQEVKDAVKTLKGYCNAQCCATCCFNRVDESCSFRGGIAPLHWNMLED